MLVLVLVLLTVLLLDLLVLVLLTVMGTSLWIVELNNWYHSILGQMVNRWLFHLKQRPVSSWGEILCK